MNNYYSLNVQSMNNESGGPWFLEKLMKGALFYVLFLILLHFRIKKFWKFFGGVLGHTPPILTYPDLTQKRKLSLGVSTVETNRDRDRDFSMCRDIIFQTVEKISTVETDFFLASRDLDKNREISIFRVVETVETWFLNCRDVVFQTVKKISTV